jgi:VanZ family protein
MGFVLLAAIALIAFGTLSPFTFHCPATLDLALSKFQPLLRPATRGDLAGNLVLFVPLGLAFMAWARRLPVAWRFLCAVAFGALLSLSVELAQACIPRRTSSWSDVGLNALSTAIGALLLPIFQRLIDRGRPGLARADVAATLLLGTFLIWQLAPFVPTIDLQKWKNALKPLLATPDISLVMLLSYTVVWLMVARLAQAVFRPNHPLVLWILLLLGEQAAELIVVDKTLRAGELLGGILGVALASLLYRRDADPARDRILAGLFAAYVIYLGLEPFTFSPVAKAFHWIPFGGFVQGSMLTAVQVAGQKLFCYGGLIWILTRAGLGLLPAGIAVILAVGGMEVAQTRLPGRLAEVTDPILALMAMGLLWLTDRRSGTVAPPARNATIPNNRSRGAKR